MRLPLIGLVVALLGSLPPGGTFVDDDQSVHQGSIEAISAEGITTGCNPPANNRYCPDASVTRGHMAAFVTRALDLEPSGQNHFVDDEGHLFENAIDRLAAAGITRGCNPPEDDRFCPDRSMTRGEMAAMLVRAFGYPSVATDRFLDDDGSVFESAINALAGAGITEGCNPPANDRFCPGESITRAQMATFLTRSLELDPLPPPERPHPPLVVEARESWGARAPKTSLMHFHALERLTIHHAGTQSGVTGPAQFRGWQNWHMSGLGWGDLAYHLIIGVDGTVYEGRDLAYEGDTDTSYDTTGHFLVVVEGHFDNEKPTAAQLDSLVRVLAWASEEHRISPDTISGHRDHAATTCPGTHLHALIESGELQKRVEHLIDDGGVDVILPS